MSFFSGERKQKCFNIHENNKLQTKKKIIICLPWRFKSFDPKKQITHLGKKMGEEEEEEVLIK